MVDTSNSAQMINPTNGGINNRQSPKISVTINKKAEVSLQKQFLVENVRKVPYPVNVLLQVKVGKLHPVSFCKPNSECVVKKIL